MVLVYSIKLSRPNLIQNKKKVQSKAYIWKTYLLHPHSVTMTKYFKFLKAHIDSSLITSRHKYD